MGVQITVPEQYSNFYLAPGVVANGGETVDLTDAEWAALGASMQGLLGTTTTVADPTRDEPTRVVIVD